MDLLTSITGSVMRHLFTGAGGVLVAQGWVSAEDWEKLLAGAILAVAGLLWSVYQKWKATENQPPTA